MIKHYASSKCADLWVGRYRGRRVAVKVLKTYTTDDLTKVKKVSALEITRIK